MKARGGYAVVVVAVAAVLTAACSSTTTKTATNVGGQTYNVAWFSTRSDSYLAAGLAAGTEEAKKFNIKITLFDSHLDPNQEYSQVQDAITLNRFQGFIIFPANGPALVPLVEQAVKRGIKVVGYSEPLGVDQYSAAVQVPGVSAEIDTSPATRGKWMGEQMIQACAGLDPCKIAYLAGVAALATEQGVKAGYEAAIKQHPNIREVAYLDGTQFTAAGGQKVAGDLLAAHSDVNVIASAGDAPTGVILALKAAGKSFGPGKDQVRVLAAGSPCTTINSINQGQIYSTQPNAPDEEGRFAVDALATALHGSKRAQAIDPVVAGNLPPVISQANARKFHCEY